MTNPISDAARCRKNGWRRGTRLVVKDCFGAVLIEITALGNKLILARPVRYDGEPATGSESIWTLGDSRWRKVKP